MDVQLKAQDSVDPDFIWEEYLEESKAVAAPPEAFTHVEHSLESVFKVGMKLEIPNPDYKESYWCASVIMTCGELLSLRYAGFGEDRSCDFWFDVKSGEFHYAGWCKANSKKLFPPKVVLDRHPDYSNLLESELMETDSVPTVLENRLAACMPIEQIKCNMKVEISDEHAPANVWIATILQNVGGRLLLRYDGLKDDPSYDFWMFYLCDRLYYVGYAAENDMRYSVPAFLKSKHSEDEWNKVLKNSLNSSEEDFPAHILEPKTPLEEHGFKEGMKLEAVNPQNFCDICPATISKVVNKYYFLVTIDSYSMDESMKSVETMLCCNSNQQLIFPINWARDNGLELKIPKGYEAKNSQFVWDDYLRFCNAVAAPSELFLMCCMNTGFQNHMKLEAVDPLNPNKICAATVEKIVEPIMFLSFDVEQPPKKRTIITGINSLDIYPVGWCASNSYPLQTPAYHSKHKNAVVPSTVEYSEKPVKDESSQEQHGKSWCPAIYFNHRCFTGPLLSKSRLAELPQKIGPGSVHLVMNDVLTRVVNIAYKSSRVLQLLQVQRKRSPNMQQQVVKAKYKGKSYRATIDVVQNSAQVEEFCKEICKKLECCTYLFGPKPFKDVCPNNCYTQTKTKFGYSFVKKNKKPGRPISAPATDSAEAVRRGPGRKKKRKHWTQLLAESENSMKENIKQEESSAAEDEADVKPNIEPLSKEIIKSETVSEVHKVTIVKKKLKHIPSSNIVTRGAKLPNFGLWHHVTSFHSRRGRPRTRPIRAFPPRKVGRPLGSTKKVVTVPKVSEDEDTVSSAIKEEETKAPPSGPILKSNPKDWTIDEVENFILGTDCAPVAPFLKDQEIDGQALLMLDMCSVQEFLNLKPEPAQKFCCLLQTVKIQFFKYYSRNI